MHVVENKSVTKHGKKIYSSVLLRESYRENGKVKKRTIANLSNCSAGEIAAIKLALKHKDDLSVLGSLKESVELHEGLSVGAVWTVYEVAKGLGIEKALGEGFAGKLAMWQVIARVIDQGSRLSAVRLAHSHAASDVLGMGRGFDENDLYENLQWLSDHQTVIEEKLFAARRGERKADLFLYDVTSSYVEGTHNYFGEYGYNRDGKKGKEQIVIGLLCDEEGEPVSTEVFAGNTHDTQTFGSQVQKAVQRFGCERVTMVGDRGMIKGPQVEGMPEGMHYITAITKAQIRALLQQGTLQMGLFDTKLCEVADGGVRYILRRNPLRAQEMDESRRAKQRKVEELVARKNGYLREHGRAKVEGALREVRHKIEQLKLDKWLAVSCQQERSLKLEVNEELLKEVASLDGCYVLKTDLPKEAADKGIVHDRYKDLAAVERAFRTSKSELEVRPVYVQRQKSTRGHVLVVMLAYLIMRELGRAWAPIDMTVKEGLAQLATICSMEVSIKGQGSCLKIPRPRERSQQLLKALDIHLPQILPHRTVAVVTRKKLPNQRKLS